MASIRYLTVQDLIWINLQVTKTVNSFDYAHLEDGTFYQYSYGDDADVFERSLRLLRGFAKCQPFADGNEATAFIAFVSFLLINGLDIQVEDIGVAEWISKLTDCEFESAVEMLKKVGRARKGGREHANPTVFEAVEELLDRFPIATQPASVAV